MFASSSRTETLESKAIREFTQNSQSTHNQTASNSLGIAFLALRKIYLTESSTPQEEEKQIKHFYQECAGHLKKELVEHLAVYQISPEKIDKAVKHLFQLAKTAPHRDDAFDLYLEDKKKQVKINFSFKEVLGLVWKATQDHERHAQNYAGTPEEQLSKAKADYPFRLLTLFKALEDIAKGTCYYGSRNRLGMTLNGTFGIKKIETGHENLHIVEDPALETCEFLKSKLNDLFWKRFQDSSQNQQSLASQLFAWIETRDATTIFKTLDPENTIREELYAHFRKHGSQPERTVCEAGMYLPQFVTQTYKNLSVSINPQSHPTIAKIQEILAEQDLSLPSGKAAVMRMRDWIKTKYRFNHAEDAAQVDQFYLYYSTHLLFTKVRHYLNLDGTLSKEAIQSFSNKLENYLKLVTETTALPVITSEELNSIQELKQTLNKVQGNELLSHVPDFFRGLRYKHENYFGENASDPYPFFLEKQEKLKLTDETLNKLMKRINEIFLQDGGNISFEINSILLHGCIVKPEEWSTTFANCFHTVLEFLADMAKPETIIYDKFAFRSYEQFAYLWEDYCYKIAPADQKPIRPSRPYMQLLLPQHVKTADDWIAIYESLGDKHEMIYQSLSVWIDKLILGKLTCRSLDELDLDLLELLLSLPLQRRKSFIQQHLALILPKIENPAEIACILETLPAKKRVSFLKDHPELFVNFTAADSLYIVLSTLPDSSRVRFLEYLIQANPDFLINAYEMTATSNMGFLTLLPEKSVLHFVEKHLLDFMNCAYKFSAILSELPENVISILIEKHKKFVKAIKNGKELAQVLEALPDTMVDAFLVKHKKLIKKIQDDNELIAVLYALPIESLESFLEKNAKLLKRFASSNVLTVILNRYAEMPVALLEVFLEKNIHLFKFIKNADVLGVVISRLPESLFEGFLLRNKKLLKTIQIFENLSGFILNLRKKYHNRFFERFPEFLSKIKSAKNLAQFIDRLETENILPFISAHPELIKLIKNENDLLEVLSNVPIADRETFLSENAEALPAIKTASVICRFISLMPKNRKLELLERHKNALRYIKTRDDLFRILQVYPPQQRLNLLRENKRYIDLLIHPTLTHEKNTKEKLPEEEFPEEEFSDEDSSGEESVAESDSDDVITIDYSLTFFSILPQKDRKTFLDENKDILNLVTDTGIFISTFSEDDCHAILEENPKLLDRKKIRSFELIIRHLPEMRRESFLEKHETLAQDFIKKSDYLRKILTLLPPDRREPFLYKGTPPYWNRIKDIEDLEEISGALDDNQKERFYRTVIVKFPFVRYEENFFSRFPEMRTLQEFIFKPRVSYLTKPDEFKTWLSSFIQPDSEDHLDHAEFIRLLDRVLIAARQKQDSASEDLFLAMQVTLFVRANQISKAQAAAQSIRAMNHLHDEYQAQVLSLRQTSEETECEEQRPTKRAKRENAFSFFAAEAHSKRQRQQDTSETHLGKRTRQSKT